MRGGALPPALIFAALGAAMAFVGPRARPWALCLALAAAAAALMAPAGPAWVEPIFLGCWIAVLLAAASVHLPAPLPDLGALALALNSGAWAGAVVAAAGRPRDLLIAAPWILLALPGTWLVATRRPIVVKVAAGWLIAIALLAIVLPLIPTPGYMPDHMD
jgi:hypothetical protein